MKLLTKKKCGPISHTNHWMERYTKSRMIVFGTFSEVLTVNNMRIWSTSRQHITLTNTIYTVSNVRFILHFVFIRILLYIFFFIHKYKYTKKLCARLKLSEWANGSYVLVLFTKIKRAVHFNVFIIRLFECGSLSRFVCGRPFSFACFLKLAF